MVMHVAIYFVLANSHMQAIQINIKTVLNTRHIFEVKVEVHLVYGLWDCIDL